MTALCVLSDLFVRIPALRDRFTLQSTALARRNKGIYEPEFRLPLMAVYGLFTGCGYLGWGVSAQYLKPWIAPVVSFGIVGFGQVFGLTLSVAYVVDSFGGASASALTTMMVMKVSGYTF